MLTYIYLFIQRKLASAECEGFLTGLGGCTLLPHKWQCSSWVCNGQKAIWLALGLSLVFQDGALVQIVFLKVLNGVTIT